MSEPQSDAALPDDKIPKVGHLLFASCSGENYGKVLRVGLDENKRNVIDIEVFDPNDLIDNEEDTLISVDLPRGVNVILRNVPWKFVDLIQRGLRIECDTPANNCYRCTKLFWLEKIEDKKVAADPVSITLQAIISIEDCFRIFMEQMEKGRGKWPVVVRNGNDGFEITAITAETFGMFLLRVKPARGNDEAEVLEVQDSREIHWEGSDADVLRIHLIRKNAVEDLFLTFDAQRRAWVMSAAFTSAAGVEIHELGFLSAWSGKIAPPTVARAVAYTGNVIQFADGHKDIAKEDGPIAIGARVLCERPHADRDYSYQCGRSYCRCMKPK